MSSRILERDWNVLLDSLERGNCVALLGPNLHIERSDNGPCNLTTELSRRLAGMLEDEDEVRVRNPVNPPPSSTYARRRRGWPIATTPG